MSNNPVIKQGKVQVRSTRYLRRKPNVKELIDKGRGRLTDQSGNHEVTIEWQLNKQSQKDKIFKLQIDDKVVYLDLEELTFYTRIMFLDIKK